MPGQPKVADEGGVEGTQEEGQRGERTWFNREGMVIEREENVSSPKRPEDSASDTSLKSGIYFWVTFVLGVD